MPVPSRTLAPIALVALELLHEGPKHPYEIHQTMQERDVWRLFKLTTGSLYHTIDRLERDGLIEAVETSREGRRPERTTYRLTDAGEDAFAERVRAMIAEPAREYPQYSVAISLLHELAPADALKQLERRALALEGGIAAERTICDRLRQRDVHELYWADLDLRLCQQETELSWTRRMIERIESREVAWPDDKQTAPTTTTSTTTATSTTATSTPPPLRVVPGQENTG